MADEQGQAQVEGQPTAAPPGVEKGSVEPQAEAKTVSEKAYKGLQGRLQREVETRKKLESDLAVLREEVAHSRVEIAEGFDALRGDDSPKKAETARQDLAKASEVRRQAEQRQLLDTHFRAELEEWMRVVGVAEVPEWDEKIKSVWEDSPMEGYKQARAAIATVLRQKQKQTEKPAPPPEELSINETGPKAPSPSLDALLKRKESIRDMTPAEMAAFKKQLFSAIGV